MKRRVLHGDCLVQLRKLPDNSVDSLVTDPPAGISFMSAKWDSDKGGRDQWIAWLSDVMQECMRVLKPGGHGLVWALPRTSHWTAMALENSGFEVRDCVSHVFGSGFPKSSALNRQQRDAFCQCGADKHSNGRKDLSPNGDGYNSSSDASYDDAHLFSSARRSKHEAQDSMAGYQRNHDSCDALPRRLSKDGQVSSPSRRYAQGHNHYGERGDDLASVSADIPSRAQCKSRRASKDYSDQKNRLVDTLTGTRASKAALVNKPTRKDTGASEHRKSRSFSQPLPLAFGSGFPQICQACGKANADGWYNGGIKPAHETWWLIRKPLGEKTVAANVLKWGTGAINIDASRIEGAKGWCESKQYASGIAWGQNKGSNAFTQDNSQNPSRHIGRFPANLLFSHNPDCRQVGTRKVGIGIAKLNSEAGRKAISTRAHNKRNPNKTNSVCSYGTETVAHWQCSPGCAVAELDRQSGTLKSGARDGKRKAHDEFGTFKEQARNSGNHFKASEGTASRFFYVAKASRRDRGEGNTHPTVKSTALMQYLIRLVTPPNGIVLDPFMGSGSTGVAAKAIGMGFIGIEAEKNYYEIAKRRVSA